MIEAKVAVVEEHAKASGPPRGLLVEVLALPAYRRWSITTQLVRLPVSMSPLAFLLLATAATGNYRLGGVMIAVATAAEVALAAPAGRFLDRTDMLVVASRLLLGAAVVLGLLAAAGALNLSGALLVALATVSASLSSGAPAGMRRILTDTVPFRLLTPALAVDGVLIELTAVSGPLLVAGATVVADVGGVGSMAVLTAAAAFLVRGLVPRTRATAKADRDVERADRLWSPSFALWFAIGATAGQGIGLAEICALPIAQEHGGGSFTAVLFQGVLCAASATAGLLYGSRSDRLPGNAWQRAIVLLGGIGVGALVLATHPGLAAVIAGYILVGLCTAPLITTVLISVQTLAPEGRTTEAFGLNTASTGIGYALAGGALALLPLPLALASCLVTIAACVLASLLVERPHKSRS